MTAENTFLIIIILTALVLIICIYEPILIIFSKTQYENLNIIMQG